MKCKIIVAAVGALTAIIGFTSSVRAQATQEFTLSGKSLDIENLTIKDDYQEFFGRSNEQENISLSRGNPHVDRDDNVFYDGDDGRWQISEQVELQVNEPLSPPVFPAFPHQDGASIVNDIDRAELQYNLLD